MREWDLSPNWIVLSMFESVRSIVESPLVVVYLNLIQGWLTDGRTDGRTQHTKIMSCEELEWVRVPKMSLIKLSWTQQLMYCFLLFATFLAGVNVLRKESVKIGGIFL